MAFIPPPITSAMTPGFEDDMELLEEDDFQNRAKQAMTPGLDEIIEPGSDDEEPTFTFSGNRSKPGCLLKYSDNQQEEILNAVKQKINSEGEDCINTTLNGYMKGQFGLQEYETQQIYTYLYNSSQVKAQEDLTSLAPLPITKQVTGGTSDIQDDSDDESEEEVPFVMSGLNPMPMKCQGSISVLPHPSKGAGSPQLAEIIENNSDDEEPPFTVPSGTSLKVPAQDEICESDLSEYVEESDASDEPALGGTNITRVMETTMEAPPGISSPPLVMSRSETLIDMEET